MLRCCFESVAHAHYILETASNAWHKGCQIFNTLFDATCYLHMCCTTYKASSEIHLWLFLSSRVNTLREVNEQVHIPCIVVGKHISIKMIIEMESDCLDRRFCFIFIYIYIQDAFICRHMLPIVPAFRY